LTLEESLSAIEHTPAAGNAEKLDRFFAALREAARGILLLDYDGTMAPFRVVHSRAFPYAGVRELLARIQNQGRTRMAIITGRPAGNSAPLLGLDLPLEVWGLHGVERIRADGQRELEQAPPAAQARLEQLRQRLHRDSLGGLFEDKPNAAVMHWRGLAPQKAAEVERRTHELFDPLASVDGLRLLRFDAGVELRVGRDKGGAVEAILAEARAELGSDRPVSYLGDDLTDEAAFHAVNASPSPNLSVLMRRAWRETGADIWMRPPKDLRAFLLRWAGALEP
jgi:trehalose 6-phosphate phosphatase